MIGKLYRKKLVLCNRGKVSLKVQAKAPPELEGYVEFNPDMGFVQSGEEFEIGVKFRPTPDALSQCAPYAIPETGVIAVPVRVFVPQQVSRSPTKSRSEWNQT